jgi:uncharacterized protein YukE
MSFFYIQTDAVQRATRLLDEVVPELNAAIKELDGENAEAVHGPTAGPAAAAFRAAWRAELGAIVLAVRQLADTIRQSAVGYEKNEERSTERIRTL